MAAQQKGMQANVKLAGAMSTTTKTMVNMNKIMKPEDIAKNMRDFEQASAKLDMTDELSRFTQLITIFQSTTISLS